ncbi:Predicted metal-sulfur cluster enzyme [gamma proteobacterium HdN1]|nr:Predicted metal-sulfur cluster enzyme [gamma proteobacterium HdN1]
MMTLQKEQRMALVQRDCPARLVPSGEPITIARNTFVTITQAKGGTYTVTHKGNMARIDGTDADALGLEPVELHFTPFDDNHFHKEHAWEALSTVYDPEIPVNIVELGLVYDVDFIPAADHKTDVLVTMTLTSPTCGMGQVLTDDVRYRLQKVPHIGSVDVNIVFDPPWDRDRISDEAKLELGLL